MIKTGDIKGLKKVELKNGQCAVYVCTTTGDYCLAVESWHVDFDGLISYPAIKDHREDWLSSCGYETPAAPYSKEARSFLMRILQENEAEILSALETEDPMPEFWSGLIKHEVQI